MLHLKNWIMSPASSLVMMRLIQQTPFLFFTPHETLQIWHALSIYHMLSTSRKTSSWDQSHRHTLSHPDPSHLMQHAPIVWNESPLIEGRAIDPIMFQTFPNDLPLNHWCFILSPCFLPIFLLPNKIKSPYHGISTQLIHSCHSPHISWEPPFQGRLVPKPSHLHCNSLLHQWSHVPDTWNP